MSTTTDIKNVLSDQVASYRSLLELLQRERECLIALNASGVETLSKEKDTIVLKLRLLEQERIRLMDTFSGEHGRSSDVTLTMVSEITGDASFRELRVLLVSLIQAISEMNEFNRILIDRSMGVVKNSLRCISGLRNVNLKATETGTMLSREV